MKTIILDTNFLIYCVDNKIDLFSELDRICGFEYKIKVLSNTVKELERLKPKNLKLIKLFLTKIEVIQCDGYVDTKLIELSGNDVIIATHDKELKKKLKGDKIIVRQNKYLELK